MRDRIDVPAFESSAMYALGWTDDPETAARLREMALSEATEPSDAFRILSAQMANDQMRDAAWEWLREHPRELSSRLELSRGFPALVLAGIATATVDNLQHY